MSGRVRVFAAVALVAVVGVGGWWWVTRGQESTDDAQVEAHVTPIAARVGGTVARVAVADNQVVDAGAVLLEIDTRDFEIALAHAQAELADAQATATAASTDVPITATTTSSNVATARGGIAQAEAMASEVEQSVEVARARVAAAQARQREQEANAVKAARDVERLRGLLEKDEISQQQFDAAAAATAAAKAAVESAASQVVEAQAAIRAAESRLVQARVGRDQADAELRRAQTAPEQVTAMRARASSAAAKVARAEAAVKQAALNLEYARITAPVKGTVSRRAVEPGQVIQPGQPLLTIIPLDQVWITANFKETQLAGMRAGQPVRIEVDAYGGREFAGRVDSIAAATGARFSLLPPDNASGNFVKVVQRIPVKIAIDEAQDPDHLLRPGMSVTPTVYTR